MNQDTRLSEYRTELRERILHMAMTLFKKQGIRRVKMDDIARALSISKRTLYEIFQNKEDLLCESIRREHELSKQHLMEFAKYSDNEMDVVVEALKSNMKMLADVSPLFFEDLQHYASLRRLFRSERQKQRKEFLRFFSDGVAHGFFRKDLNLDIIAELGDAMGDYIRRTHMYERYPVSSILSCCVDMQIRGLCTEKGLRILQEKLAE